MAAATRACCRILGCTGNSYNRGTFLGNVLKINNSRSVDFQGRRFIFSQEYLGIDGYKRQKAIVAEQVGSARDKFFERVEMYLEESKNNNVFSEDLNIAVHIAESDKEIEIMESMIKRYHTVNHGSVFSTFNFGPVVMRLLHVYGKGDIASTLLKEQSLNGFFSQASSFFICMDLLYKNNRYAEIVDMMDLLMEKLNSKCPMDCLTLFAASCFKLNDRIHLEKLMTFLRGSERGVTMRTIAYSAMCAYNLKDPNLALEILAMANIKQGMNSPSAYLNIKMLVLTELGRHNDSVDVLKSFLPGDFPREGKRDVFAEVISKLLSKLEETGNKELIEKVMKIEKDLVNSGSLSYHPFSEYLDSEVHKKKDFQAGYKRWERTQAGEARGSHRGPGRPGLRMDS